MHKVFFIGALYVLLFSLLFPAPVSAQLEKTEKQEITIVSLLGDFFVGRRYSSRKPQRWWYVPVPEWGVNHHVQSLLLNYLEEKEGITASVWKVKDSYLLTCFHEFVVSQECKTAFFSVAREKGYETILVVMPKSTYEHAASQTESFAKAFGEKIPGGYGLIDSPRVKCTYALFSVGVYDVQTEETFGRLRDNEKTDWSQGGLPCYSKRYRDEETEKRIKWKDTFDEFSPQQKEWMQSYIERGLKEDLSMLLPELKFFKN